MEPYKLPAGHDAVIDAFEDRIQSFKTGELNSIAFKGIRVANGVYEQRKPETFMLRIRNAGCIVTADQLQRVSELSEKYGAVEEQRFQPYQSFRCTSPASETWGLVGGSCSINS